MSRLAFYSDPHFDHAKLVLGSENHPTAPRKEFGTVDMMNHTMLANIRGATAPGTHLYCLGDFAFCKESVLLWGPRVNAERQGRIILGNHDNESVETYRAAGFKKITAFREFDGIAFTHFPIAPWSAARYRANVHGHCHEKKPLFYEVANPDQEGFQRSLLYINISMENTRYMPVSLEQIQQWVRESGR